MLLIYWLHEQLLAFQEGLIKEGRTLFESSSEALKCTSDLRVLICACVIQTFTCIVIVSVHASIEALMMLSDDVDIRKSPVCSNAPQFSNNTASSKPRPKKMKVLELPLKAKPRKEFKHEGLLPVNNFPPKSKATAGYENWFITWKFILFNLVILFLGSW